MGAKVTTIETIKALFEKTRKVLPQFGYQATFILGDGTLGAAHSAPFHKIIVTAGAPSVPNALVDQLAVGGIMVIPVGDEKNQTMIKITKDAGGTVQKESLEMFRFVPLKGKQGWASGS
jgi:protein-L-isoaspartate(D-aspartate) O-methyltransferase